MSTQPEFDQFAKDYETVLDRATQIGGEETGYFASYKRTGRYALSQR